MIKWNEIEPAQFEGLCYELLEQNGFTNLQWFGKSGGDRGRDIVAVKFEEPLSGIRKQRKWIIQCKRYIKSPPSKTEIEAFLASAREHSPDVVLLVVSNTLNAGTKDWLDAVRSEYRFEIYIWEEKDLERQIAIHRAKLRTEIKIRPASAKPTLFYQTSVGGVLYMCSVDGLEEFGLYLLNDYGPERNAQWLKEFVDYIRHHEIEFDLSGEPEEEEEE